MAVSHTKIIATLGPATDDDAALDALLAAGVDVVRLNFSHGTHESHRRTFDGPGRPRPRRPPHRRDAGPERAEDPHRPAGRRAAADLREGEPSTSPPATSSARPAACPRPMRELARAVRAGDRLLLDDGRMELAVEAATASRSARGA